MAGERQPHWAEDACEEPTAPVRRFEPWPWALAGALATMMAASIGFYAIARAHPDPLLVDDAFAAGERYNAELSLQRRAEALGVEVDVELVPSTQGVDVVVETRGADGELVRPERVVVRRERPAEGELDADFELDAHGSGFSGSLPLPRPGRWRLVVTAEVEGLPVRKRLALRAP